jgi:hypothetical protein
VVSFSASAVSSAIVPNHSLAADEGLHVPSDPTRVFESVVATNDLVCQECYRRLVQREAFDHETGYSNREILAYVDEEIPWVDSIVTDSGDNYGALKRKSYRNKFRPLTEPRSDRRESDSHQREPVSKPSSPLPKLSTNGVCEVLLEDADLLVERPLTGGQFPKTRTTPVVQ